MKRLLLYLGIILFLPLILASRSKVEAPFYAPIEGGGLQQHEERGMGWDLPRSTVVPSPSGESRGQASKGGIQYKVIYYPTPNISTDKMNRVEGVILHHTAEPTVKRSLEVLTSSTKKVGTHVVIDTDGTRYIMAPPTVVTYHAGFSVLDGKEGCNDFTIGIEFQGNTLVRPLTDDQIRSAIEYLLPIISKYKISLQNIVTHEMVRNAYKRKYPQKKCSGKPDITQVEYKNFMNALKRYKFDH